MGKLKIATRQNVNNISCNIMNEGSLIFIGSFKIQWPWLLWIDFLKIFFNDHDEYGRGF